MNNSIYISKDLGARIKTLDFIESVTYKDFSTIAIQEIINSKGITNCTEDFINELVNVGLITEQNSRYQLSDNTSGTASDLDQDIDYMIVSQTEEYLDENGLVFYKIHQGGDIRGNYGSLKVVRVTEDFHDVELEWLLKEVVSGTEEQIVEIEDEFCDNLKSHEIDEKFSVQSFQEDHVIYVSKFDSNFILKVVPHSYAV